MGAEALCAVALTNLGAGGGGDDTPSSCGAVAGTADLPHPMSRGGEAMKAPYLLCVAIPAIASAAVSTARDVHAQTTQVWPTRPIRLVLPFPPGGATDTNARVIAREMEPVLGQPLVFDNRAGANSIIGCDIVAKAAPDGYTIMYISVAFAINPSTHKKLPFDTARDFTPITNPIVGQGSLLAVNPSVPAKSVPELIALAKKQKLSFSSPGVGNVLHLIMSGFMQRAGIEMLHVPYKGAAPAMTALMAGEVQAMVVPPVVAVPHIKSGKLRPLGYSGAKRLPVIADVPTIAEAGLTGFAQDSGWHAMFGPAKMPQHIVDRLHDAVQKSLQVPSVREFLQAGGYEPTADTPAVFQKNFRDDLTRWGALARAAGIDPI
jgi:tripartite-type tricarboxylate transporter receptor subunit TctC